MKLSEWLELFRAYPGKKLFSVRELAAITGEDLRRLSVELNRLTGKGVVRRVCRSWYENPFCPPSREEIAMVLRRPSYLSLEYALSRRGVLLQSVERLTLVTTELPYTYRTERGVFEYHQVKPRLFWGYEGDGAVLVAHPEKALLDLLYLRCTRNRELSGENLVSLLDDMDLELLDVEKLREYSEVFPKAVRRLLGNSQVWSSLGEGE